MRVAVALAAALAAGVAHAQSDGGASAPGIAAPPGTAAPAQGTWLEYRVHRAVGGGTGQYDGFTDSTESAGRYEITASDASRVELHALYSWRYSSSEKRESGRQDRRVWFGTTDRIYGSSPDLDDYDRVRGPLATWTWIPPGSEVGAEVQILEHRFTVRQRDASFEVGDVPVTAIVAYAEGTDRRDDDYGAFDTTYRDTYWFDQSTGMVLATSYEEDDSGSYEGKPASFTLTERFELTRASYVPGLNGAAYVYPASDDFAASSTPASDAGGTWVLGVLGFGVIVLLLVLSRRSSRDPRLVDWDKPGRVRIVAATDRARPFSSAAASVTRHFGPFVDDLARKTLAAGGRVEVAAEESGAVVGVALLDAEAGLGTIFCNDTSVTEGLRALLSVDDFFTETRHSLSNRDLLRAKEKRFDTSTAGATAAYNVHATYRVLRLDPLVLPPAHDPSLVSRMREADLADVEALAREVYRAPAARWLRAQLDGGDVGYVARADGKLVGFALVSCVGTHGRVHALTVHPEARGLGVGTELMRARLHALAELGAIDVITEIADSNLASLRIALEHGFRDAGEAYVESAQIQRTERALDRR